MGPRGNEVWAMDFVHDQLATGRKIGLLTVVDTFSHFSPVVDPGFGYRGEDLVKTLELACKTICYPTAIRVDQGSEFVSRDLDPVGLCVSSDARLQQAGKADRQRLRRSLQRSLPGGVLERTLVPDACRRGRKG